MKIYARIITNCRVKKKKEYRNDTLFLLAERMGFSSCYRKVHCTFLPNFFGLHLKIWSHMFESDIYMNKKRAPKWYSFLLAERMGFEPMWLLAKRFSRPPRYDRFDTSPYLLEYIIIRIFCCQDFFIKKSAAVKHSGLNNL